MNNVGLPLESTETHQVDFIVNVKEEEDEDEEFGYMSPCSLQNEDTKNFTVFQCKTETGNTEFNIVQNETLPLQATVEVEIKKEEDDPQFGRTYVGPDLLSMVRSERDPSPSPSGYRGKEEEINTQTQTQTSRDAQLTPDTLERAPTSVTTATTSSAASNRQNDSPVALEGWVKAWEEPNGIPAADVPWLRDDCESGLFTPLQTYRDAVTGEVKKRRVLKSDRMWFHPPEPPYNLGSRGGGGSGVPMPETFFRSRVFFWRPVGVWGCALKCPCGDECAGAGGHTHLSTSGYHTQVLSVCDLTGWYIMLTEVLSCGPCLQEAYRSGDRENEIEDDDDDVSGHTGRWLAWDDAILRQLSPAHCSMFPAVLTARCGVDKGVLDLLRNWTQGNTDIESNVDRVWRRLQENHLEKYKHRWDLYTTVLRLRASKQQQQLSRNVLSVLGDREFRNPLPPLREVPCARLLRRAFLLGEAGRVQDCRSRILSTFGSVLKMDSSKMMAKSASLEGGGSAKWFTCITNELSQIVTFVLTCEEVESVEKLRPMCQGLMERFRRAEKPAPRILYVDWGCCGAQGPETAIETLFQPWVNDSGMVVRLDISDWIRCFDDALRTNTHSKCATFESVLTEAVLEYERQDLDLLIAAVRAGDAVAMETLSDEDVVQRYASGEQLRRHVRRVTRGVKETLRLVQLALEEMKGPSGLDENGVSLFKSSVTIDELWARQQRHLECLQDPPGVSLYQVSGYTSINGVDVPFYTCLRESISLERFHRSLHRMIPGSQCAAQPYQVRLLGGIARWNADRTSEFLFGNEEGPQEMVHSVTPPLSSLTTHHPATHQRCSDPVLSEEPPVDRKVSSAQFCCWPAGVQCDDELLGLEYLLRERTGDSSVFSLVGLTGDILDEEEEEDAEEEEDDSEVDEAYLSDEKPLMDEMDVSRITLICSETTTAVIQPPALAKRTYDTATSTSLATITRSVPPAASHSSPPPSLQPKLHISALAPLLPNSHTPLLPLQSRRTTDTATFTITTNRPTAVLQTAAALSSVQPPMVVLTQPKTPDNTTTSTITRPIQSAAAAAAPSTVQLVMVPLVQRKSSDLSTITRPVPTAALQSIASSSAPLVLVSPVQPKTPDIATTITSPTAALQSAASPTRLAMVTHLQPNTTNIATTTKPVPTTASVHPKTRNTTTTITRPQLHSRPALPPLLPSSAAPPPPQPGPESGSGSGSSRALPPMLPQASWSRSTIYKRKQVGRPAELRAKQSRIKQPPTCKACGQLIQGHLKHKKKTFCPDKNISPSQGLDNRVYRNFEHFVSVVDGLED